MLWRLLAIALLLCAATLAAWVLLVTGPRNLALYPPAANSPYKLPWTAGVERLCIQGNRGVVSHREREEFAYDFAMPVGSEVCAARSGVVDRVEDSHDGDGFNAPNNYVVIRHDDGTLGWYLHIQRGGSLVRPGDAVAQGQPIAASGNVGHSMLPHLHFHVTDGDRRLLPVTLADVDRDRGVPRMFKQYVSQNRRPD